MIMSDELKRAESEDGRTRAMAELRRGDRLVGPDGATRYEVTAGADEHERGWVSVRNLSMSDAEAEAALATPGAVEPGTDPRDGFFAYSHPVTVRMELADEPGERAAEGSGAGGAPSSAETTAAVARAREALAARAAADRAAAEQAGADVLNARRGEEDAAAADASETDDGGLGR
jgi:hypothetical protein